jgi:SAM-dependent methyltransferase
MSSAGEEIELQRRQLPQKRLRYSFDFSRYYHHWYNELLLGLLVPHAGYRGLDCGCGTGILLPCLERSYGSVIGLDLSLDNLQEARRLARRTSLVAGDVQSLPLAAGSFDQVICRAVLYRLDDVPAAFRGLFDILRDGGDLVVTEPISDSAILRIVQVSLRGWATRTHTSTAWIRLAEAAGFRVVRWFNLGYVAWPLLGYPELTRVMRYLPLRMSLARLLLRLDILIARIPWVKRQSWHGVFHFRKPCASHEAATRGGRRP